MNETILNLTARIVAAHVGNNAVRADQLPTLIREVHRTLATVGEAPAEGIKAEPVVEVKKSVFADHLVCLGCGRSFKTLKKHLGSEHAMTAEQYRAKYGLPRGYPMVRRHIPRCDLPYPRKSAWKGIGGHRKSSPEAGLIWLPSKRQCERELNADAVETDRPWIFGGGNIRPCLPSGHVGSSVSRWHNAATFSDLGRSAIWRAGNYQPLLLGRNVGCRLRLDIALAASIATDVGAWPWAWNCGVHGQPVYRPNHQGSANRRRVVGQRLPYHIPDRWVLGSRRRHNFATADASASRKTCLTFR